MIQNHLLSALPEVARKDLFSHVIKVSVSLGEVLHRADEEIQYVYFPETCVISILAAMEDGSTVEVGVIGNEGMLGLRVLLGVKKTPHSAVVQVAGTALRMRAPLLEHDLRTVGSSLRPLLLPYTQALLSQLSQSVACVSQHSIRQRLARWLLQMGDRTGSASLDLTQELISLMLGIRRASAGDTLREFRDAQLIATRRGGIRIVDRPGLEKVACECYRIVKNEIDHLYSKSK
jgi:CRP-like cAMP-binding protein